MIYKFNDYVNINTLEISEEFTIDNYDNKKKSFAVDCENVIYSKIFVINNYEAPLDAKFIINKSHEYKLNTNSIRYLRTIVYSDFNKKCLLLWHNNFAKSKIWINGNYVGYFDNWYGKKIFEINKGVNELVIELFDCSFQKEMFLCLCDLDYEVINYHGKKIKINVDDIEKFSFNINKSFLDGKDNIDVVIEKNDYTCKEESLNCFVIGVNKNDRNDIIEVVSTSNISFNNVNKLFLDISKLKLYDYIFLAIDKDGSNEFNGFSNSICRRINLGSLNENVNTLAEKIDKLSERIMDSEANEHLSYLKKYYINDNSSNISKYYSYDLILGYIEKIIKNKTYINYILSPGLKTIIELSQIDNSLIKFYLNVPSKKITDKTKIILVTATSEGAGYIDYYKKIYGDKHLIIECSVRGKTFGNGISNYAVIEVLKIINKYINLNMNNLYMIGYSGAATTVSSLLSKYPKYFKKGLSVCGLSNISWLKNINDLKLINISGTYDMHIEKNYIEKGEVLMKNCNSENLLARGLNNALCNMLLRNKELIDIYLKKYKYTNEKTNIEELSIEKKETIIDFFNKPVRIVSSNYCEDEIIIKTFETPKTLIDEGNIKVKYPVITKEEFYNKNYDGYNYIFINEIPLNCIDENDYIICENDGFYFNQEKYSGDYSIIQICKNIKNNSYILLINYNNELCLKKNFYLRHFLLPSEYSSDENALNNKAIIYYKNKYYFINKDNLKK